MSELGNGNALRANLLTTISIDEQKVYPTAMGSTRACCRNICAYLLPNMNSDDLFSKPAPISISGVSEASENYAVTNITDNLTHHAPFLVCMSTSLT
eukprot:CAMPEP_0119325206 /NCGR_PEP_ID=MMETSP1333-20130426/65213_1 /TAXON_ID=418940 /ORGANISM="Scyphosphaera apsteinii, Strain RCC1455" /LENGTH=96 /DNA_ID=CAMNT_0007333111 /DNA_START=52 /DNA_END=337 /DNA_ORIENTATION=+